MFTSCLMDLNLLGTLFNRCIFKHRHLLLTVDIHYGTHLLEDHQIYHDNFHILYLSNKELNHNLLVTFKIN